MAISARPGAAVEQVARDPEHQRGDGQHHQEHPLVGAERQPERRIGLEDVDAHHALGERLDVPVLEDLRHGDGEREGGERQIVAFEPQRGQPEQVAGDEAHERRRRQRRPERPSGLVDQDGGGVGADGEEGAVPERDLAVEAGEQDEAQHGDGIDDHQAELQELEVADEAGLAAGDQQQRQDDQQQPVAVAPERSRWPGAGRRWRRWLLWSAMAQTRFTVTWPNRPLGFSVRTVMTMMSATVSFSPLPTR